MFINGYFYGVSDQLLYIPVIQKILDSSLYQNDILFEQQSGYYTLFLYVIAYLSKIFSMEWVFFIAYFISRFVLFYSIYRISVYLFKSEYTGYIAILLCFISKPIGGTAAGSTHFLTLRTFTEPITLLAIWLFLERKYIWTAIISAVAFQIHPITAIAPIMAIMGYTVFNFKKIGGKNVIKSISVFALAMSPLLLKVLLSKGTNPSDLSLFSKAPEDWLGILKMRNTYTFPSMWNKEAWRFTILYPVLFAFSFIFAGIERRYEAIWIVSAGLFCLLISYVFGERFPIPLIVQLQVARGIFVITFMALIYSSNLIYRFCTGNSIISRITIILSGAAVASLNTQLIICGIVAIIILVLSERFKYLKYLRYGAIIPFMVFLYLNHEKLRVNGFPIILAFILAVFLEILRIIIKKPDESGNYKYKTCSCTIYCALKNIISYTIKNHDIRRYIPIPIMVVFIIHTNLAKVEDILFKGNMSIRINLPGTIQETSWIRLQKWANENTDKDSLFIVPRELAGFRIYSMRSTAGDWKDGAPGLFSIGYARKWNERMKSLGNYDKLKEDDFIRLARDYKATHIITRVDGLNFDKVHSEDKLNVYKLP